MGAVAVFRTRTGVYRNSGTLSVDVETYWTPPAASITRVDFTVTKDGGAPTVVSVSAPSFRHPNYSDASSPVPGADRDAMARAWLYGFDLDFATFTDQAVITAQVFLNTGGPFTVPFGPIIAYRADSSSRPNTAVRYCNYDTGNDSTGDGSNGNPYKTLRKAADVVLATSGTRNGGGGRVICQPCAMLWFGNGGMSDWYTSGHWPLTFEFQDGATLMTKDDGTESPVLGAYGIDASKPLCYVRIQGSGGRNAAKMLGSHDVPNPQAFPQIWSGDRAYQNEVWLWIDGMRCGSKYWTPGKVSMLYDSSINSGGSRKPTEPGDLWFQTSGAGAKITRWGSCLTVEGASNACVDFRDLHDSLVQDCTVIFFTGSTPFNTSTGEMSFSLLNCVARNLKTGVEDEKGYVDLMPQNAGDLVASTQSGGAFNGKLRIDQVTANVYGTRYGSIATDKVSTLGNFAEIVGKQLQGADIFYAYVKNWPAVTALGPLVTSPVYGASLEGNQFRVLATGTNAQGFTYAIFDAPGVVTQGCPVSPRPRIFTGDINLVWAPHSGTDHMFQATDNDNRTLTDTIRSNVAMFDLDGPQGPFMEMVGMTRCAFVNYNHFSRQGSVYPGIYYLPWSHKGMAAADVILAQSCWSGSWQPGSGITPQVWTNCLIVNNVFRELNLGPGAPAHGVNGCIVSHNHLQIPIAGGGNTWGAFGTSDTNWYETPPISPVQTSFKPAALYLTAPYAAGSWLPMPVEWRWPGVSIDARGGLLNAGIQSWAIPEDQGGGGGGGTDPDLVGDAALQVAVSGSGTAHYSLIGTDGGTMSVGVQLQEASAFVGLFGDGAGTVGVALAASAHLDDFVETLLPVNVLPPLQLREYLVSQTVAVQPSDSVNLAQFSNGFLIGTAGAVSVHLIDDTDIVLNVPANYFLPLRAWRINLTGTTASNITAVY